MIDEYSYFPGCGEHCPTCHYHAEGSSPHCPGCDVVKGRPFWGECKIYSCHSDRGVQHCGLCGDFPCDDFINHYEEALPEGQRNAVFRAGVLAYRARHGDEKAVALLKKLRSQKAPE